MPGEGGGRGAGGGGGGQVRLVTQNELSDSVNTLFSKDLCMHALILTTEHAVSTTLLPGVLFADVDFTGNV